MNGPRPDARLSKYRIIRPLGSGGMGDVYLAHDTVLKRDVAVKFIAQDRIDDQHARRRLVREAQAAAALDHPCICAVYEVHADADGPAFIAMQYVEGKTLAKRLQHGPLDPEEALPLFADITDALVTAHRSDVIHRDLKPENIILTPSGKPKLLDFGIAHVAPDVTGAAEQTTHTRLTHDGTLLGTPGYMAPEQVEGKSIDARTDLFSLGCVLYQCLTGQAAFVGHTPMATCAAVLHLDPPAPSRVRPALTDRYDGLCCRLLAKNPRDRFQTAQELLGALRMLLPDRGAHDESSTRRSSPTKPGSWRPLVAAVAVAVTGLAGWMWQTQRYLFQPAPRAEAVRWYERGISAIRDGTYESARRALEEALAISPDYPQAYVRLAEAHSDLDEELEAKDALLSVDRTRLDTSDRLRFDAIAARTTGNLDVAVARYEDLAARHASDAAAWLDLGRAQELAGRPADARASYERAIRTDGEYAAAHLRLGLLEGSQGRRDRMLNHLDQAEHLYRATSHVEGEAEALLARGILLAGANEFAQARSSLERALALASGLNNRSQEIRARLAASSLTAAEGRLSEAEEQAAAAVKLARDAELDAVAANGLIDLAVPLMQRRYVHDAARHLNQAIELAERRRAHRTALRAKLQLASLTLDQGRPQDAIGQAESILESLRTRGYRRWELTAFSIASRGYEYLGNYDRARALSAEVLQVAEALKDDSQIASALENLAGQATAQGLFPEALKHRVRAEDIHTRQGDTVNLAFDLQNRAELLIRLGRGAEAESLLGEIDKRAAAGVEAFANRGRRVKFLRALRATFDERFDDAARLADEVVRTSGSSWDATAMMALALVEHSMAHGVRDLAPSTPSATRSPPTPRILREIRYWEISTLAARRKFDEALDKVLAQLQDDGTATLNEFRWRIAACGAIAARQRGNEAEARQLSAEAAKALDALRPTFGDYLADYLNRPDLVRLRRQAAVNSGS